LCTSLSYGSTNIVAVDRAGDKENRNIEIRHAARFAKCYYKIGKYYDDIYNLYSVAYGYHYRCRFLLECAGRKETTLYAELSYRIAGIYLYYGNYEDALSNYLYWFLHPEKHNVNIRGLYNAFGMTLEQLGLYRYSLYVYNLGIKQAYLNADTIYIALNSGNAAISAIQLGEYDLARRLLALDYKICLQQRIYSSAANALLGLLEMDYMQGRDVDVIGQLTRYESLYQKTDERPTLEFHEFASAYFEDIGDLTNSLYHQKRVREIHEFIAARNGKYILESMKFDLYAEQEQISKVSLQENNRNTSIYALLSILFFVFLLAMVSYWLIMKLNLEKLEKQQIEIRKKSVEQELNSRNIAINELTESVNVKTQMLNQLNALVEQLSTYNKNSEPLLNNDALLNRMINSPILTEEHWIDFKKSFVQVYPNFIANLKKSHNQLTDADIRHACLLRLNLSSSEIANIIGVSKDSIRKSNQRLRQKLCHSQQSDMVDYIFSIAS